MPVKHRCSYCGTMYEAIPCANSRTWDGRLHQFRYWCGRCERDEGDRYGLDSVFNREKGGDAH